MRGSGYPTVKESAANWATINEATTPLCGNLPNEVAAAVEALQAAIGPDPSSLTDIGWGASDPGTVAALVALLCRYEIGTFTWANATATAAVTFTNSARFTSAPKVFLLPELPNSGNAPNPDDTWSINSSSVSTSGFTAVRNISNGTTRTGQRDCRYLAIQWPD